MTDRNARRQNLLIGFNVHPNFYVLKVIDETIKYFPNLINILTSGKNYGNSSVLIRQLYQIILGHQRIDDLLLQLLTVMMEVLNYDNLLTLLVGCRADVHHRAGVLCLLLDCGDSAGASLDWHKADQLAVRRHDDLVGWSVDKLAVSCLEMAIAEILKWNTFIS